MSYSIKSLIVQAVAAAFAFTVAASNVDVSKLPAPAEKKGVTYEKEIKPLLDKSCLQCHGQERPKSKYRVDSREATIKGGSSGDRAIIEGNSAKSLFVHYIADLIEEMEMPPTDKRDKFPAFSKEEIALIRAWIDQGAK
jgi:mono/diheme cytochrome c family protein